MKNLEVQTGNRPSEGRSRSEQAVGHPDSGEVGQLLRWRARNVPEHQQQEPLQINDLFNDMLPRYSPIGTIRENVGDAREVDS